MSSFQVVASLPPSVAALPSKGQDLTPQIELFETYMGLEVQHGESALHYFRFNVT